MSEELKKQIHEAVKKLFGVSVEVELERPDEKFGDYSTNVALRLAGHLNKSPKQIAEELRSELKGAEIAGPGFLNFMLSDEELAKAAESATNLPKLHAGQEILVEFGDPNPFKEMHIGHAYSYIAGDAIANLLEVSGARVERLSYHGDVGRHVARAIWGIQKEGVDPEKISDVIKFNIGTYYALGAKADESSQQAKAEIDRINQLIYSKEDPEINRLYEWGRKRSLAHFELTLEDLEVHKAEQFFESQAATAGAAMVRENTSKVFEKSDGAIVYPGEKVGLHTRVFITSTGLPTYEAKDLGLAKLKDAAHPKADASIIITAHEQAEYFKVMLAALAEIDKPLADKTRHLYHGFVSLSSGKMSSRTGKVYSALSLIVDVDAAAQKQFGTKSPSSRNAAIKYGFLKHRLGSDIVYDVAESVSLEGNSGPYLQYAHARARSILAKAKSAAQTPQDLESAERSLARKISEFPEVVALATNDLMPHYICTYLYELAQNFNRFYEANRVVGDKREAARLALVQKYADVLQTGLGLLNIEAPEKI